MHQKINFYLPEEHFWLDWNIVPCNFATKNNIATNMETTFMLGMSFAGENSKTFF